MRSIPLFLLACLVAALLPLSAGAVTAPYINDFSVSVSDFTETTNAQWFRDSGAGVYSNVLAESDPLNALASAVVEISNLGGPATSANDFTISTNFTINTDTSISQNPRIGLASLGGDANLTDFDTGYYRTDVSWLGLVRMWRANTNGTFTSFDDMHVDLPGGLQMGTNYTMTLAGIYAGSVLQLTFTITDGVNTGFVTGDDATPLEGQFFGYHTQKTNFGPLDYDFDDFSIVPEPSAAGTCLSAISSLALLRRRWYALGTNARAL